MILFVRSQWIVEKLREDNRNIVQMYSEIIAEAVVSESDENLNFIFDKIISRIQFPIIQSDANRNPQSWKNISFEDQSLSYIKQNQELMDKQNTPIKLFFSNPLSRICPIASAMKSTCHSQDRIIWLFTPGL